MPTVNFNMRLDTELRDRAFPVIERFGLSPAQAFKLFLTQAAATNTLPLSFDYPDPNGFTPQANALLKQSIDEMAQENQVFATIDDMAKVIHEND